LKRNVAWPACCAAAALNDLREVIVEFLLFDDEKPVFIGLDQPQVREFASDRKD
jgi:hypothetical protein